MLPPLQSLRFPVVRGVPRQDAVAVRTPRRGRDASRSLRARVAGLAFALVPLGVPAAERLVVVTSNDQPPFQEAVTGLRQAYPTAELLQAKPGDAAAVAHALAQLPREAAIVTLGRRAAEQVAAAAPTQPVVNCMVPGDAAVRPGSAHSVPMDVPVDAQIAAFRQLLPAARTIGILFDPAQNERRAADTAAAWKRAGYVPVQEPVPGPAALPAALNRMTQGVDVLYAIPDRTVFAAEHSRALFLFSFRHQIPLVGPTEGWVRAGALFTLDWSHTDLGRYCGALALRQLSGGKGAAPPPPRTRLVANARTAANLRMQWSDEVRKSFDKVYE